MSEILEKDDSYRGVSWLTAVVVSVVIHLVVLAIMGFGMIFHSSDEENSSDSSDSSNRRIVESSNPEVPESTNRRIDESTNSGNSGIPESTNRRIDESTNSPVDEAPKVPAFYFIQKGDTLTKIAKKFGLTPQEIAKANGKKLSEMNNLWIDQKIRLK